MLMTALPLATRLGGENEPVEYITISVIIFFDRRTVDDYCAEYVSP
jgi:hypothetical protein